MTFSQAYQYTIQCMEHLYDEDEARAITKELFRENFNANAGALFTNGVFTQEHELEGLIARLQTGEPLQYVLGVAYFCGLKIGVDRHVLIPRPETEELVELAKTFIEPGKSVIADICTGSGCIALALHSAFKANTIIATDISKEALLVGRNNEKDIFGTNSIHFEEQDILKKEWPFAIPHVVVCNPPYIERSEAAHMAMNVMQHEPHLALFVEDEDALLFYKAVVETFLPHPFPTLLFEMNPLYSRLFVEYCRQHHLHCEIREDMQGKERFTIVSKS